MPRKMSANAEVAFDSFQNELAHEYDQHSSKLEDIWGDHMHHGFYDTYWDAIISDHRNAQIRTIEESLRFASISDSGKIPSNILDVGCGLGATSRYLSTKFGAKCVGINISTVQVHRAQQLSVDHPQVSFQVADALNQPFPDGEFDLVWCMECAEHIPDKQKFVNELARVTAPGGRIVLVTWCRRNLSPSEESLRPDEKELLNRLSRDYYFPEWCSAADYVDLLESLSLQDIKSADWSQYVAPFWLALIKPILTWKGITHLLTTGWKQIMGTLMLQLTFIRGYNKGLIKIAIITCQKPTPSSS